MMLISSCRELGRLEGERDKGQARKISHTLMESGEEVVALDQGGERYVWSTREVEHDD